MNIFERIITEDRGIMKEYENIVDPIFDYIVEEEERINRKPNSKDYIIEDTLDYTIYQLRIPSSVMPKTSWFGNLTIIVKIIINKEDNFYSSSFDEAYYNPINVTFNKRSQKIQNGLIYVSYCSGGARYTVNALGHEFMHLYEDYNRLKNNKDNNKNNLSYGDLITSNNDSYNNILQLINSRDKKKRDLGLLLYTLTDTEQHAIVQEIFTVVKNNVDINKENYQTLLYKESNKYKNIIIINDTLLPYLKRMTDGDWYYYQNNLTNIFRVNKSNGLVDKNSFINFVEQTLFLLIKKVNRAIHYGIEERHSVKKIYVDKTIGTNK